MFQLAPILWLRSFATPSLSGLMAGVSILGYTAVYAALLLVVAFAVRLRLALALMLVMLLSVVTTDTLKTAIAFPRPDAGLHDAMLPAAGSAGRAQLTAVARTGDFWSLPSESALLAVRSTHGATFGFPSGHVSAATAFSLGLLLFLRPKGSFAFALFWPILMGISRMYLGRHFLADVLGGAAVGAMAAVAGVMLCRWIDRAHQVDEPPLQVAFLGATVASLFTLASVLPVFNSEYVGRLCGLLIAYGLLARQGFPVDKGSTVQRVARVLLAGCIYLTLDRLLNALPSAKYWSPSGTAGLLTGFIPITCAILGGISVARLRGWYRETA